MPEFRATVRIEGLRGEDAEEVRHALQARLSKADLEAARVVGLQEMKPRDAARPSPQPRHFAPGEGTWRRQSNAAGFLLLAAAGWAAWFFWSVVSRING